MNPGLTEEVAKVANSAVSGLGKSPLAMSMMLFNLLVLGGVFWLVHGAAERQERRIELLLNSCISRIGPLAPTP